MKRKIFYGLATIIVGALTLAAVANGPYYAFPAWAQKLVCATTSNCPRFIVLADWNSEAVLDRETGLVWERSPSTDPDPWGSAELDCVELALGGRLGWRLPTIQELASLFDPANVSAPRLPPGHPFVNVQAAAYWSANKHGSGFARVVRFSGGGVDGDGTSVSEDNFRWCVRGGPGAGFRGEQ